MFLNLLHSKVDMLPACQFSVFSFHLLMQVWTLSSYITSHVNKSAVIMQSGQFQLILEKEQLFFTSHMQLHTSYLQRHHNLESA